jgi:O-acetyl-ADP-ribose deacetylase (regulator of RNase III)
VNLHLVDPKSELCAEWEKEFATLPNVTITQGKFEQVETYECLINAGNSFGIMDGGVDLAIARFFPAAPTNCQRYIVSHYAGEQPVGTSFITRTGNTAHPYIAHTPAYQMALAYTSVLAPITTISWQAATRRHNAVRAMDISHQPVLP